ncbi:RNA-directed DNA polymerase (Reverse transcriptase), Ribonuclease H-like protein [Gossypium australe]|uniref:RNA-directed DNA polymerase (Reverse transcriptase), Ribonuclease H-like protein n=1 Tax=Gossypium australe TaxID=47621 RepID=A0A5B6VCR9_9ROSI|nr:RNA-directed DNA polymerase (Reverse transcriptase), Ribonuclease H-like protein [Gossypium australe]
MAKLQQEIRDQMLEAQKNMMAQMTQMLSGAMDKGKGPMAQMLDFTPPHAAAQPEEYPQRPSGTIRPQQGQADTRLPMNFQAGSGSNPGAGPANPMVPDLDKMAETDKARVGLPRQLEDRYKWLEEKLREMETADHRYGVNAKDLSLVSDLVLPPKFKIPDFEKYNGTSCPEAHNTMFYRWMAGHVNNDQLLIHCFQDSLVGSAARWYNQLSRTQIKTWKDLAQAFMKQYGHVADLAPDRIMLQNMEKMPNESFRQYVQRWREVAMQVQLPLLEKETTMLFINTLKAPFITHMIGSTTKRFADIVMAGEMIENAIRGGKIEVGENAKRAALRKKDSEVNNMSTYNKGYSKVITVSQPKMVTAGHCTPYPKWYDSNAHCDYHAGIAGHSIENCTAFKKVVDRIIKIGVVKLNDTPSAENPLPNHGNKGINGIGEKVTRNIKGDISEVKTSLRIVWSEMVRRGLIELDSVKWCGRTRDYYEFHKAEGHEIQECVEFRILVQSLMDNKEWEFYEEGLERGNIHDNKRVPWNYNCNVTIPRVESSVSTSEEVPNEGFYTRSGKRYDPGNVRAEPVKSKTMAVEREKGPGAFINEPVKEKEAKEFLKFLKHGEYSVVEQLRKQPARISVLALLLSSEVHREALMKVLNEIYVTKDISVNKLDRLVSNISADNFIYFSDDEIPPGGTRSIKAFHITTHCKGYTLSSVLVDNGSALNVLPLSALKRLPIDSSHMKACQNIVRTFDGTKRRVMGRMDVPLLIGPNTYEVDFLVMDIKPSYNCLLGRPWIHSTGAVPSSLHQKLKLVTENRLVTINAEEDIIATVTNEAPYVKTNEEAIECSFRSLEFVNATFILEGNEVLVPKMSRTTRMGLQMMVVKGALPGNGLARRLHGEVQVSILKEKRDRFGLSFKPDAKQMKKKIEKKQERRRALLSGEDVKWESMTFPHISQTFVSGGIIHLERGLSKYENPHINAISQARKPIGSQDINDMSNDTTDPEVHFEQDMCLEESQDFEEEVENIAVEEGKVVRIGTHIAEETKQDLVELIRELKDVFAWSYQDMPGLSTDIVVHRLPIREECKPVQQKLRRMRPDVVLKIKEEVKKQFDAGFLQVVKYSERVADIVPVPKKDGKVRMCVDYRDLNKASPKDNFPLPHIDTLVDNTAGCLLFSFMDGFSGYNQIKMHLEDMEKTTFIMLWGTFCYKVYVDDMITKSRTEKEHIEILKKLFLRLRKFQMKLNLAKCTFGARSEKLLGFVVSERGIEVDSSKVKAIQELPPPRTQKEVRGFLGRLNYIARFISQTARWQILLSEFDIVYVNQNAIKGSAIAEFLASRALEDYEPLSFDFPNEELMYVANTEECPWKLKFDGASNAVGNGIGAILVSPNGDHYPFTCKLDFDCTNNMVEYEAYIMGIRAAIERKIRVLEVYRDSALVIYQLKGE